MAIVEGFTTEGCGLGLAGVIVGMLVLLPDEELLFEPEFELLFFDPPFWLLLPLLFWFWLWLLGPILQLGGVPVCPAGHFGFPIKIDPPSNSKFILWFDKYDLLRLKFSFVKLSDLALNFILKRSNPVPFGCSFEFATDARKLTTLIFVLSYVDLSPS